jgi:hypothetical protein
MLQIDTFLGLYKKGPLSKFAADERRGKPLVVYVTSVPKVSAFSLLLFPLLLASSVIFRSKLKNSGYNSQQARGRILNVSAFMRKETMKFSNEEEHEGVALMSYKVTVELVSKH